MELKDILSPRIAADNPEALPRVEGARLNVLKVKERACSEGITADWACAQGLSRNWGAKAAPQAPYALLVTQQLCGLLVGLERQARLCG